MRRCDWPANQKQTGEPLHCRWRRRGSARIGADAEALGSVRRAKFPRNLPVPCRLSDVYGPRQTGMGAIVMERAMAPIDKPHCSACGDEMELSLLIPPFGKSLRAQGFYLPKMRALQRLSHWQARSSLAVVRELKLARRLNLEST